MFDMPPFLQALIDQDDAENRDRLAAALKFLREHAEERHRGQVSPCGRALLMFRCLGRDQEPALTPRQAASLIAYTAERLLVAERELARRIEAGQ